MKKVLPYLFVAGLFGLFACNNLLTQGMFMDGLIYSSVADNLAHGHDSLWHLTYTRTNDTEFYGHLPLAIWMMALWFKVFGTSMLTAKAYALLMVVVASGLMVAVWKQLGFNGRHGWLPLLMWFLISDVVLLSCNNFLESTMLLFVLASVGFMLKGGWWHAGGGLMLALAFLSKGPTGLFPLVLPPLLWAFGWRKEGFWRMVGQTLLVAVTAVGSVALLCLAVPEAAVYLQRYYDTQIVESLGQEDSSRFYIVGALFGRSSVVLGLAAVAVVLGLCRKSRWTIDGRHWRTAAMLFVLTLCGCLPMMLSPKQYPHYLLADFPFMALTTAALIEPMAKHLQKYLEGTAASVVAVATMAAALALNGVHYGKPGRDKAMIEDMNVILPQLADGETVTIPDPLVFKYNLHGYYYFYRHVSLDQHNAHRHLLTDTELGLREWEGQYREVPLPTTEYRLYELVAE